jgi:glycerate dehydrogenase
MRIVILDGFTANPGDLSWSALERFGSVTIHERTASDAVISHASDADVLLTNKTPVTAETIAALPALRYIGVLATGYNIVDTAAAAARGIPVTNVPEYSTTNVAQAVFALLLELTNHTAAHAAAVRAGRWSECKDFCFWEHPIVELAGLTLGLVGLGRIGTAVGCIGQALGMEILTHRRQDAGPFERVSLEQLCERSDVLSLHCPLTPETRAMVNAPFLARMKSSAFLINTARGPLVEETALADALNQGRIAGAGLDVLSVEPPGSENPLLTARNCIITPHIAWASKRSREKLIAGVVENLAAFVRGERRNCVNGV